MNIYKYIALKSHTFGLNAIPILCAQLCVSWLDGNWQMFIKSNSNNNESTEVQTLGAIRIQLYHQCFEQV